MSKCEACFNQPDLILRGCFPAGFPLYSCENVQHGLLEAKAPPPDSRGGGGGGWRASACRCRVFKT